MNLLSLTVTILIINGCHHLFSVPFFSGTKAPYTIRIIYHFHSAAGNNNSSMVLMIVNHITFLFNSPFWLCCTLIKIAFFFILPALHMYQSWEKSVSFPHHFRIKILMSTEIVFSLLLLSLIFHLFCDEWKYICLFSNECFFACEGWVIIVLSSPDLFSFFEIRVFHLSSFIYECRWKGKWTNKNRDCNENGWRVRNLLYVPSSSFILYSHSYLVCVDFCSFIHFRAFSLYAHCQHFM